MGILNDLRGSIANILEKSMSEYIQFQGPGGYHEMDFGDFMKISKHSYKIRHVLESAGLYHDNRKMSALVRSGLNAKPDDSVNELMRRGWIRDNPAWSLNMADHIIEECSQLPNKLSSIQ